MQNGFELPQRICRASQFSVLGLYPGSEDNWKKQSVPSSIFVHFPSADLDSSRVTALRQLAAWNCPTLMHVSAQCTTRQNEPFKYTFTVTGQKGQCLANILDSAIWKSDFFFYCVLHVHVSGAGWLFVFFFNMLQVLFHFASKISLCP